MSTALTTAEPVQTYTVTRVTKPLCLHIHNNTRPPCHTHVHTEQFVDKCFIVVVLTSARTAHESEVVETRHLVLEGGGGVAELGGGVLVVSSRQYHLDAVVNVAE